jgi:large subunit ribosomal protein L21
MYAVVSDRNQQWKAVPGERVLIALRKGLEKGSKIEFDKVCAIGGGEAGGQEAGGQEADGAKAARKSQGPKEPLVGTPYIKGAKVTAVVVGEAKGEKLVVAKYRRRKASRRRTGHRARYTEIQVESIQV